MIIEIILFVFAFLFGYLYGKSLKNKNIDVDNIFVDFKRKTIFLGLLIFIFLFLVFITKFSYLFPTDIVLFMNNGFGKVLIMSILFLAGVSIPLSTNKPKHYSPIIISFALFCIVFVKYIESYIFYPVYKEITFTKIAKDGSILQTTNDTCTAASLANVLKTFKINSTEKECARILGTNRFGTSHAQLLKGLNKFGLTGYEISSSPENINRVNKVMIVSIWFTGIRHSIVIYGKDDKGNLLAINPINGKETYSQASLKKIIADDLAIVILEKPIINIDENSPEIFIRQIQQVLKKEKYLSLVNGQYDFDTINSIKSFQVNLSLNKK